MQIGILKSEGTNFKIKILIPVYILLSGAHD